MSNYLSFFIVLPFISFAQLHVSENSFIYNSDRLLFVKNQVSIANNGNIYLRKEGQLLQGNTTSSTNQGLGTLSLYQEGTSNNFAYNYWCSPVGGASAIAGNSAFGISQLSRPISETTSTAATLLPNTIYDGVANPLQIAARWIYKFLSSSQYAQWIPVHSASTILAGEGFTMKGTAGVDATSILGVQNNSGSKQRYDFRGKPNSGDIVINLALGQRTLTGNPYPSAIDLILFLNNAVNSTGIAYFWEHDKTVNTHILANYVGGYGTFSPTGATGIYVPAIFHAYNGAGDQGAAVGAGAHYPRRFAPIGQGFLLEGNGAGATVVMQDIYRVYQKESAALSVFERGLQSSPTDAFLPEIQSVSGFDYTTVSTLPVPQIKFSAMLNDEAVRKIVLGFDDNATDGVDHAKDAKTPETNLPADLYFVLNNDNYVISVTTFDENKRMPLGFNSSAASNLKFTVDEIINFNPAQSVYLFDKVTGIYHNIVNQVFSIDLPPGIINDRFEITFLENALNVNGISSSSFTIYQNNIAQLLTVLNPTMTAMEQIALYSIDGKQIFKKQISSPTDKYEIDTAHLAEGVYIVKINQGEFIQKVMVNRK